MFGTNRRPILRQDSHYPKNDQNELPVEPRDPGVPSGASKTISDPLVRLFTYPALTQQCLQTDQNEIPHDPRSVETGNILSSRLALSPNRPK
jgi:hypothetical protein